MLSYVIPFIFFGIFTQAAVISDDIKQQLIRLNTTIGDRSCSFYTEFEKLMPCGNDGYALRFADHYCRIYLKNRDDFRDRDWQDAARRCLQTKLYDYATKQQDYPSCKRLEEFGFDSHPPCYEKPDETKPKVTFCSIPFMDKAKIAWMAKSGGLMQVLRGAASINFCL
jgi:hypothetical protein